MLLHLCSSSWGGERDVSALNTESRNRAWLNQLAYKEGEMVHFTVLIIVILKNVVSRGIKCAVKINWWIFNITSLLIFHVLAKHSCSHQGLISFPKVKSLSSERFVIGFTCKYQGWGFQILGSAAFCGFNKHCRTHGRRGRCGSRHSVGSCRQC